MKRAVPAKHGVSASQVAAVIPTRGDVDMAPVVEPLKRVFGEVVVWDNSAGENLGVYGRFVAIDRTTLPVIFTIDDDNVATRKLIKSMLAEYRPGHVVCNVPRSFRGRYHDSGLVGFGGLFDRDLPDKAFAAFGDQLDTGTFRRCCDLIFTMLTPMIQVDLPYVELEVAHAPNRMWKQRGHFDEREQVREMCRQIRQAA